MANSPARVHARVHLLVLHLLGGEHRLVVHDAPGGNIAWNMWLNGLNKVFTWQKRQPLCQGLIRNN